MFYYILFKRNVLLEFIRYIKFGFILVVIKTFLVIITTKA